MNLSLVHYIVRDVDKPIHDNMDPTLTVEHVKLAIDYMEYSLV